MSRQLIESEALCDCEGRTGKHLECELPAEACGFVEQFDMGHDVEPFDFELEIY